MIKNRTEEFNGLSIERCRAKGPSLRLFARHCSACQTKGVLGFFRAQAGQHVIEYALMLTALSLALTGIFVYGKRGLQATIKATADQIAPQEKFDQSLGPGEWSNAVSVSSSETDSFMRSRKNATGSSTEYSSFSGSSGNTVSVSERW